MNFVTTRKEALDVMERYIENNISDNKFTNDFDLITKFKIKKLATIDFSSDIYNFDLKKTHISFKAISSLIKSLV